MLVPLLFTFHVDTCLHIIVSGRPQSCECSLLNKLHVGFTATDWMNFNLMLRDCDPKEATQTPTGLFNVIAFYDRNKDFVSK